MVDVSPEPQIKVWDIEECGYLVRGTLNVRAACHAVVRDLMAEENMDAREAFDTINGAHVRPGLYRWNPCTCTGGHRVDMAQVGEPGRGVFEGVEVFYR